MYGGWGGVGDWEGVSDGGGGLKFKFRGFLKKLKNLIKSDIFSKNDHLPASKNEVGSRFSKNPLPAVILNFFFWTPNFTKLLNP